MQEQKNLSVETVVNHAYELIGELQNIVKLLKTGLVEAHKKIEELEKPQKDTPVE